MIRLEGVHKVFASNGVKTTALHDASLHVKEGEWVVLKGPSGSGKSTILSLIAGLAKPTEGNVIVAGKPISKLMDNFSAPFRRKHIGFVFQKFNLIPSLSVKENIIAPLIPDNEDEASIEAKALSIMQRFLIADKADSLVKNLSGGEQQRVAIARALINQPKILIADEPTANLDAALSASFVKILMELKQEGVTIVVATHDELFFTIDEVDSYIEIRNGTRIA